MKAKYYVYVYAWGKYMRSDNDYIKDEMERAANDDAPVKATYKDSDSQTWRTIDDVKNPNIKLAVMEIAAEYANRKGLV